MDGVNHSSQPAPANPPPENSGNQQKAAEGQAEDFAKKMGKKSKDDARKSDKEEMSLASLFAEHSKKGKDEARLKREQGEQRQQDSDFLGMGLEKSNEQAQGIRDLQASSQVAGIKNIDSITGPKEINEVINKLVDKIHVSAKDVINGAEVRITMKENILPGTEIRIQRMGGELTVTMNTTSADTHNFLAVNEASLLKSLNERFGDKVQVNINLSGGDQPGDGRSREQYEGEQEEGESER